MTENTENTVMTQKVKKPSKVKGTLSAVQRKFQSSQYLYLILCFLIPIILVYIMYIVKGLYPWTSEPRNSVLVLDLNAQYVSFFEALRGFVYGDNSLLYSFSRSFGGEFMGIYAYYAASPLTYLVALFPADRMQEAVLLILLIKTGLSAVTFGFYLHKRSRNPKKLNIFIFSMMYALSSYAIVQQNNTMWIDALILLPLFAYSLELLISERRFKLYTITLAGILICNYYIGYMVCIFAVLYFFFCYFSKSKQEINPRGERFHFVRAGLRFGAFSVLAALIAAFMLIAAYYSLTFGKSEFSYPNWSMYAKFDIMDFLTKLLPGAYDTVQPAGMPFIYCGLLALLLLPAYFVSKSISLREKIASGALIAVFVLSFFLNPIDLIWHGFSVPNWLNARYSFLFIFILLVLAYKAFGNLGRVGEKFLMGTAAFIVLFVALAQKQEFVAYIKANKKLSVFGTIWFSVFFTIAILVLLCMLIRRNKSKKYKNAVSLVLAAVVCLELLCNGAMCFRGLDTDVVYATYDKYDTHYSGLRPSVEKLKEYDDGFYRFEKTAHRTKNDNMTLGIRGMSNSTSTLHATSIKFANLLGYTARAHFTVYAGGTPVTDSILGIKYVIDSNSSKIYDHQFQKVTSITDPTYKVMYNPYAMSIAYGVSSDIKDYDMFKESGTANTTQAYRFFDRYNKLVGTMLGKEETLPLFVPVEGMKATYSQCETSVTATSQRYTTSADNTGTVYFTYTAPYTGDYYFYAPINKIVEPLHVSFNSTGWKSYQGSNDNHVFHAGYYKQGEKIEAKIFLQKNTDLIFDISQSFLWYLDSKVYEESMTTLLDGPQFDIDKNSTDDRLVGSIKTTEKNQMIFTTIPYDAGWNVYIDGQKLETYETLGCMLAFDIAKAGEYELEMRYMPDCYIVGFIASAFGITVFIALCAVQFVLKKTKLKNRPLISSEGYVHEYWVLEDYDGIAEVNYDDDDDDEPTEVLEESDIGSPENNEADISDANTPDNFENIEDDVDTESEKEEVLPAEADATANAVQSEDTDETSESKDNH